ncbi:GTP-binding protein [Streptomyces sp. NPDC002851]
MVIGNGNAGKTTFVRKAGAGAKSEYLTAFGAEITPVCPSTNIGEIGFQCWDTAGQENFGVDAVRDGFYLSTDGAIFMFDVTSLASYQAIPNWHQHVARATDDVPAVVVGNKADAQKRAVPADQLTFHLDKGFPYCETSALAGTNLDKPFVWLARKLTGRSDLTLVP